MIKLFFDLKLLLVFSPLCFGINRSGEGNEQRKKHFFSNHGFLTPLRIKEMYSPLSRRLQGPIVYLFKSILHDGIRAINLSRKSQGHRGMFKCAPIKTIPSGYSIKNIQKYFGGCQQFSRLANIRRFCTSANKHRSSALFAGRYRSGIRRDGICSRFHNHRFMSYTVSVGKIPSPQSSCKNAYSYRYTWLDTCFHTHLRWENARCQYTRYTGNRSRFNLSGRSRLYRFRPFVQYQQKQCILHLAGEVKHEVPADLLSSVRYFKWHSFGSVHSTYRSKITQRVPGKTATYPFLRCRTPKPPLLSYQQFQFYLWNHCQTIQMPMAGGIVFQMDKAAPPNQGFLWNFGKCGEITDLDRNMHICALGYNQEKVEQ